MHFTHQSKLPHIGASIFSVMSQLASQEEAINMAQGFPEFEPPMGLVQFIHEGMLNGKNQYAPMPGYLTFRETIAQKEMQMHQIQLNAESEITVVPGATVGLFVAIQTFVNQGDEVIVLEPAYDSYQPAIELAGGKAVRVSIDLNTFTIPWDKVQQAVNHKTKMIIINTPHNPLGITMEMEDWKTLETIVLNSNLLVLSDEVYEHMVFDGGKHISILNIEGLKDRSIKVSSFGKTFHSTGWKMGYLAADEKLTSEMRKVYQFLAFSCNSASQYGLEKFMQQQCNWEMELSAFYQAKRDLFSSQLVGSNWEILPCNGSYFLILKYTGSNTLYLEMTDEELAKHLTKTAKIASIPVGSFCENREKTGLLRFCFAKNDDTILNATNILCKL